MTNQQRKILKISAGLFLAGVLLMGLIRLIGPTRTARGGYGTYENIRGWLWSENIGWVNFNCYNNYDDDANFECCCPGGAGGAYCPSDADSCPYTLAGGNYGVSYNTTNYKVSGYAWASENPGEGLGWVCFGETCCSGTCNGELADKAPDGYDAWACVGKRKSDGSCSGDCGEYFNTADGSGCTGSGENCTVDSDNNFIAHWRFNSLYGTAGNKVEDCQGTNNEGTLSTGFNTSTALVAGKWGNALKFDGSDDYVSVADATGIGLEGSAWTVEAWVKPIQLKNYGNIFEKFPGALTSGWGIITFANGSWNFQRYTDDWSDVPGGPAGTLVNNKWTHIAVTYDGTNVRTYNDGVLYTTQAQGTITDNDLDLHIGADIPNSRYFDGVIDNVAIYSRAKTAEEIWDDAHIEMSGWAKVINLDDKGWLKLKGQDTNGNWFGTYLNNYSQGGGFYSVGGFGWQSEGNEEMGPDVNLVGHWKMNGDWTDSSGNGNNGTAGGDATWVANGRFEKAGSFDGNGDYVEVPVAIQRASILANGITFSAWIKTNQSEAEIVHQTTRTGCTYECLGGIRITGGKARMTIYNGSSYIFATGNTNVNDNNWHHIVGVYTDDDYIKIYVDGNQEDSQYAGGVYNATVTKSYIGAFGEAIGGGFTNYFNGFIDNVAIINNDKSATEIQNDYYKGWGYLAGASSDKVIPFGWYKGPYIASSTPNPPLPGSFDSFQVTNYGCTEGVPNLYLKWTPSLWAEYYNYYRVSIATPSACPDTCKTGQTGAGYSEYPVRANACGASECNFLDNQPGIEQNTGYCYCVRAFNESGNTWATSNPPNYSVPYWKKTPICPPTQIGVDGTKCGYNKVVWQPSADMEANADGYNLYRSLTYGGCSGNTLPELISSVATGNCEVVGHLGEALTTFNPSSGTSTLVGWWKMNESSWNGISGEVWDSSGNGNHGTAAGNANTTAGYFKNAGSFDGNGDYVQVTDSNSLDITSAITLEAWVKFNTVSTSYQTILGKRDASLTEANYVFRTAASPDTDELEFYFYNGGWQVYRTSNADLTTGTWYHLAVTYNSSDVKIYKNGKLLNGSCINGTCNVAMVADDNSLGIGRPGDLNSQYFNGLIDNVAIYNYAKSAAEILKDYEASPLSTTPDSKNNTCSISTPIGVYCPNNPSSISNCSTDCVGTGNFCLSCGSGNPNCCRYVDKRVVPNIPYFYRVTVFTREGGESPGSTIPSAHINGCLTSSDPLNFRRACDRSVCHPPIKIEEK